MFTALFFVRRPTANICTVNGFCASILSENSLHVVYDRLKQNEKSIHSYLMDN
jgi:hypothetical protein